VPGEQLVVVLHERERDAAATPVVRALQCGWNRHLLRAPGRWRYPSQQRSGSSGGASAGGVSCLTARGKRDRSQTQVYVQNYCAGVQPRRDGVAFDIVFAPDHLHPFTNPLRYEGAPS
jgi:hypothetical protein